MSANGRLQGRPGGIRHVVALPPVYCKVFFHFLFLDVTIELFLFAKAKANDVVSKWL